MNFRIILTWTLVLLPFIFGLIWSVINFIKKRKYGCSRCYYMRTYPDKRKFCSASCGNQEGHVCSAWLYKHES